MQHLTQKMEFLNIQSLMDAHINFSQFDVKDLEAEEKDMLVLFLQGKINQTNQRFEKLINNEKLSMILTILNGDESNIKDEILNEIRNLDLTETFNKMNNEDLDVFQIIRKYFNDIKQLLNCSFDLVLSNKYVTLYIQYILSFDEYNEKTIHFTIQKVKDTMEMEAEIMMAEIEEELLNMDIEDVDEDEKEEAIIEQRINQLMVDMSIEGVEHKEETVTYISSFTKYEDMVTIFRLSLQLKYNLVPFFQRLVKPTFLPEQYVCFDIMPALIQKIIKDTELSQALKQYILQSVVSFMNYKEE